MTSKRGKKKKKRSAGPMEEQVQKLTGAVESTKFHLKEATKFHKRKLSLKQRCLHHISFDPHFYLFNF